MTKEIQIKQYMEKLKISKEEAEELWLADNDEIENEEQEALDAKAKKVKVDRGAAPAERAPRKPREIKVSDAKKEIFEAILSTLSISYNVEVVKKNKVLEVEIDGKSIKIDIIEHRKPKNS